MHTKMLAILTPWHFENCIKPYNIKNIQFRSRINFQSRDVDVQGLMMNLQGHGWARILKPDMDGELATKL